MHNSQIQRKKFTFQQTKCFCVKKYKYIVEKITNITFEQNGATIHAEYWTRSFLLKEIFFNQHFCPTTLPLLSDLAAFLQMLQNPGEH